MGSCTGRAREWARARAEPAGNGRVHVQSVRGMGACTGRASGEWARALGERACREWARARAEPDPWIFPGFIGNGRKGGKGETGMQIEDVLAIGQLS